MLFTTGSRFFFGLAALGAAAFAVFAVQASWSPVGAMVLGSFTVASAFLGLMVLAFRDAEAPAMAKVATSAADAEGHSFAGPAIPNSPWPLIAGLGVVVLGVGLVVDRWLFALGAVLVIAMIVEWTIQAWADRASDDPAFNARLRSRIMNPFEFPIAAALIGAVVVISFSRLMLSLSEHGSVIAFAAVATLIFVAAIVLAAKPAARSSVVSGLLVVGAVALIGAGIAGAAQGERTFEKKDKPGSTGSASDVTGLLATITVQGNSFIVQEQGKSPSNNPVIEVPKATTVNVLFKNSDSEEHNLVVVAGDTQFRTAFLEQGTSQVLTFSLPASGSYEFFSEGGPVAIKGTLRVP
jgi:plastocyanin